MYARERIRELRGALSYADSELGTLRLEDVRRRDVQGLIDELRAAGLTPDRVNTVATALRVLYSYAIQRGLVDFSPVVELVLPEPVNPNGGRTPDVSLEGAENGAAAAPFAPPGFQAPPGYPTPLGYPPPGWLRQSALTYAAA